MRQIATEDKQPTILTNEKENTYRLNQDVFLFLQDDIAQLLDFRQGQFYGLDPIGTVMVSLVLEQGIEEAIAYITQTYDVTEAQVRADFTALLENLEKKQLLIAQEKTSDRFLPWLHHPITGAGKLLGAVCLWLLKTLSSIVRILLNHEQTPNRHTVELLLTLSWVSFRLLGWSRTLSLWQHWHRHIDNIDTSVQGEVIQTVDRIVREAAAWKLFLPMVCKERALVGYHILRAFYGLSANLVVGIDRYPFQIHAWVECNSLIITDDPAHCEPFTPVVRYS